MTWFVVLVIERLQRFPQSSPHCLLMTGTARQEM
jgi:hypothetical protein